SAIKDGAGTTIMMAENIHKSYYDSANNPLFCWAAGSEGVINGAKYLYNPIPSEQQFGIVWVVPKNTASGNPTSPVPGNTINNQEKINGNINDVVDFDPTMPWFARPASPHGSGANVAYCDGHSAYLRDDIDYVVYQQLMTPNGRKCVDPTNWNNSNVPPISTFRAAPPLAEKDFQ
ncbi:MAG TPA: DUF1559 domain-containing protein, partial [Lacipirellulaceae bacterium]|nr:DUF1559 domain-containing protein [Lacipirellulaceae bacterium]